MKLEERYAHTPTGPHRVLGLCPSSDEECRAYLKKRVRERLKSSSLEGFLRDYLGGMADTGFNFTNLNKELVQPRPPRDWEIGEAMAEVLLEDHFDCEFPWPTSWDRRELEGNPTGPDLPGYHAAKDAPVRFAFGEVKSSGDQSSPPLVVKGIGDPIPSHTLVGQLRRLLSERERRQNLIAWLGLRERHSPESKARFDGAVQRYYEENSRCLVVGCLISGARSVSEKDFGEAVALLESYSKDHDVWLLALYLPFPMEEWPTIVLDVAA